MKIGVWGSRRGVDPQLVRDYLTPRFDPMIVLVSGGAFGVDMAAEECWLALGGSVESHRPKHTDGGEWTVLTWVLCPDKSFTYTYPNTPVFADFASCAFYRSMVGVEETDRGVVFIHDNSRGSQITSALYEDAGKPVAIHAV